LGGSYGIPLLAVFSSRLWKNGLPIKLEGIAQFVISQRKNHLVFQFSGLLLGLGLYSYQVRELLICWLFFGLLFVSLAIVIIVGVLAAYAGEYVIQRASLAARVVSVVAAGSGELQLKSTQALDGPESRTK
jgi:hypothetical protein